MEFKPELNAFKGSAAYYEALFEPARRLEREGPLLNQLLASAPGENVLDLACGTGHHAFYLAEAGGKVTGCDLSEDMIAYAVTQHEHPRLTFQQADMRTPLPGPWDLILCIGNSLSLLPTQKDVDDTFQAVANELAPGGVFFIQVLNYRGKQQKEPSHKVFAKQLVNGIRVTAIKNLVPQKNQTLLSLSFFAEKEDQFQSIAESAVLRHIDCGQLIATATNLGLKIEGIYGDYNNTPFDINQSSDLLMVFIKS